MGREKNPRLEDTAEFPPPDQDEHDDYDIGTGALGGWTAQRRAYSFAVDRRKHAMHKRIRSWGFTLACVLFLVAVTRDSTAAFLLGLIPAVAWLGTGAWCRRQGCEERHGQQR